MPLIESPKMLRPAGEKICLQLTSISFPLAVRMYWKPFTMKSKACEAKPSFSTFAYELISPYWSVSGIDSVRIVTSLNYRFKNPNWIEMKTRSISKDLNLKDEVESARIFISFPSFQIREN